MVPQTTPSERQQFYARFVGGQTYQQIADDHGRSVECVRYWCRRQRDGQPCVTQRQRSTKGALSRFSPLVRYAVLRLRLEHPRWGPHSIHLALTKRPALRGLRLPSPATIGRYLREWPKLRRRRRPRPTPRLRPVPAQRIHQRWQLDFKLWIALADGTYVHLYTACEVLSGACVGAAFFPTRRGRRIQVAEVRTFLRDCFARWGLPQEIQTDGDASLVAPMAKAALPSRFTLWLTGLGIDHLVTRRGRPTDNAEVERWQRTLTDYVIRGNEDKSIAQLQTCLQQAWEELLAERPSWAKNCQGRPPLEAYPELQQTARPYRFDHELALFDLQRVDDFLATLSWPRLVNEKGQVVLDQRRRYPLGRRFAGQEVTVRFDPTDRHFVFFAAADPTEELGRKPARDLTADNLTDIWLWPFGQVAQQLPLPFESWRG